MKWSVILLLAAFIVFAISIWPAVVTRINLVALGLALLTLAFLVERL